MIDSLEEAHKAYQEALAQAYPHNQTVKPPLALDRSSHMTIDVT